MEVGRKVVGILILLQATLLCLLLFLPVLPHSLSARLIADEPFDVRKFLSTVSRYGVVKDIADNSYVPATIPDACAPIHLNLVARHGTRAPTKKRMRELDRLETSMQLLLQTAKQRKLSLDRVHSWLFGWTSPWKGKLKGGELIVKGEEQLYDLGIRIRDKFPTLFSHDYHPNVYAIKSHSDCNGTFEGDKRNQVKCSEGVSPLLVVHGATDMVTDPNVNKFLYDRACSKDKTLKLYEGGYHSILEGEPDEALSRVFSDTVQWLDARCST